MDYLNQFIVTGIVTSCLGFCSSSALANVSNSLMQDSDDHSYQNWLAYNHGSDVSDIVDRYEQNIDCQAPKLGFSPISDLYQILVHRGIALQKLKKYKESVTCLDQALSLQPTSNQAWYRRGIALSHLRKYDQAFVAYYQALKSNPSDYTCLLYTSPSPRDRTRSRMPSSA